MDTYEQQINTQVCSKTPAFDIRLFSIAGILVKQATSSGETVQLDVSGLPNGTYVIHIYDGITRTDVEEIAGQARNDAPVCRNGDTAAWRAKRCLRQ